MLRPKLHVSSLMSFHLNGYLKLATWNLKLIHIRRIVAHAKGKRRTEDKTETKEGPENGEGL
jgi:hypothetical protein